MHEFISYNNRLISSKHAEISAVSSAAIYGRGVFTTLSVYRKIPFLWEKHWKRIRNHAEKLNLDISVHKESEIRENLQNLLEKNEVENARIRITFFDESASRIWNNDYSKGTTLTIFSADLKETTDSLSLNISPFPVNSLSPLAGIKSCNYLENILALNKAVTNGFGEAIRVNERKEIVSACMANVFWIYEGRICTPQLSTGVLAGTTREWILENFDVKEVSADLSHLKKADTVFLCSAGIGICRVERLENFVYKETSDFSEILKKFKKATRLQN